MKKRILVPILFLFIGISQTIAQDAADLIALTIPAELKEDANMVVRNQEMVINVKSVDQMTIKNVSVVTVLNKVGHQRLSTAVGYDNHSKISSLEARVYNAFGKEIKKFRKNDFIDVSAVDGFSLYTDYRVKYLEYTPVAYPYTMVFKYEKKTSSTANIPDWNPVSGYYEGIQKDTYIINYPPELGLKNKEKNFGDFDIAHTSSDGVLSYTASNIAPVKFETWAPSLSDVRPNVLISLSKLTTDGVEGAYTNWEEFGKWMYNSILAGQDELDIATKEKVLQITADAKTDIEKAKIIYKFMQDRTRYISVQVGIGGIQPIAANQVDKVGYGDCKGLSNYMMALLDVVGIESHYVHVEAGDEDIVSLENDFASLAQGNHVILNIPNGGDDIWLECTNQSIPFGYLGDFTDNRDVLVITPEGGKIKRTPAYLNETNLQITKAEIQLDPEGNMTADVVINSEGINYGSKYYLQKETMTDLKKYYTSGVWRYNNNVEINAVDFENDQEEVVFKENLKVSIQNYATISNADYLVKVNAFDRNTYVPKRYRKRKLPLQIPRGYKDVNEFTYKIPDGYTIEVLPPPKVIESKFGTYKVTFEKVDDTTFTYSKTMLIKAGDYPKEDYSEYRKFRKSIARYENLRISLTKKS